MRVSFLFLGLCLVLANATAQETITKHPDAKELKVIWYVEGEGLGRGRVGNGAGPLGDIYGPGTSAWAVQFGDEALWRVYKGITGDRSIDTIPVQTFRNKNASPKYPIVGDFWGTGHKAVGFSWGSTAVIDGMTRYYYELHVFRTDSNRIADSASAVLNTRMINPPVELTLSNGDILVIDLDEDGADELVMPLGNYYNFTKRLGIWIFKGGESFQLDSPTIVIPTSEEGGVNSRCGDFDGDGHIDIVTDVVYPKGSDPRVLTFYFGDGTLEGYGKPENQRSIALVDGLYPRADLKVNVLDCDGDGITDLTINSIPEPHNGTYLYRSRTGKNARTRSFRLDDADFRWPLGGKMLNAGYLNDPTRRYEMPVYVSASSGTLYLFSGGANGPDLTYEAFYPNHPFWNFHPLPDANGDGWNDLIGYYGDDADMPGFAGILAGGPEIPRDPTMTVQAIAGEGHERAISVWPNPVRDHLNIAWRGDLKKMPNRFIIHDVLGREVASDTVDPGHGAALWQCSDVAEGIYLVSIYDRSGNHIATTRVIKQN